MLTEVDRVVEWSKSTPFQQPHANENNTPTKTVSLESMALRVRTLPLPTASSSVLCLFLDRDFLVTATSSSTRFPSW